MNKICFYILAKHTSSLWVLFTAASFWQPALFNKPIKTQCLQEEHKLCQLEYQQFVLNIHNIVLHVPYNLRLPC